MRKQSHVGILIAALLLALTFSGMLAGAEENVAFNVETKKYHCLSCSAALRCTKNCIEIAAKEARKRGGIPCKICGGSCG